MTCSGRLRSWYSSRVGAGPILIDFIMFFFCWYVISTSGFASAAPSLASLSAFSLPRIPQWYGIHCMVTLHCISLSSVCRSGSCLACSACSTDLASVRNTMGCGPCSVLISRRFQYNSKRVVPLLLRSRTIENQTTCSSLSRASS
jgi:hypothetical protein